MSTITLTIDLEKTSADAVSEVLRILKGGAPKTVETPIKPLNGKKAATPELEAKDPAAATKTALTIEQVRALVAAKAKAGKREAIKELLTSMNVENVTSLSADKYQEFYNAVNAL